MQDHVGMFMERISMRCISHPGFRIYSKTLKASDEILVACR